MCEKIIIQDYVDRGVSFLQYIVCQGFEASSLLLKSIAIYTWLAILAPFISHHDMAVLQIWKAVKGWNDASPTALVSYFGAKKVLKKLTTIAVLLYSILPVSKGRHLSDEISPPVSCQKSIALPVAASLTTVFREWFHFAELSILCSLCCEWLTAFRSKFSYALRIMEMY